jgi:alpha-L-fucosidase
MKRQEQKQMYKPRFLRLTIFSALLILSIASAPAFSGEEEPFQPTWESLQGYECPEWFQDAKFGIYAHWGPYSATKGSWNTDWYSRNMYREGHRNYEEHLRNYGSVKEFGYKDFIPLFKAENFDADAWVDLYIEAGARFAGPVGEHADGFAMWDSEVTPWNAADMGPKRDVVAEMEKAVRKRGLKYVVSFHHQWKWGWYPTSDPNTDCSNPANAALYGSPTPPSAWGMNPNPRPDASFTADWLAKIKEVVVRHEPDLLWFDNRMQILSEKVRMEMAAFYYNQAHAAKRPVVLTYKQPDLQEGTATIDLERSRMPKIYPEPWLTDTSLSSSSWSYAEGIQYYTANRLIDDLVDIVSKNGCLLLNVAPRPDGTIPEEQQEILRGIGAWLKINGEAIYTTRPWEQFGEGPTKTPEGHLADYKFDGFGDNDVRFTQSKDGKTLYIISLGWPESGQLKVKALKRGADEVKRVRMLGHRGRLEFEQSSQGLTITLPEDRPSEHAFALRVKRG